MKAMSAQRPTDGREKTSKSSRRNYESADLVALFA
jgi:hypothetical protein